MASPANGCPTDDELLRLLSGGFSTWRAARVRRHLDTCPVCRAHMTASEIALRQGHTDTDDESDTPQWAAWSQALQREEDAWRQRLAARTRRRWSGAAAIAATVIVAIIWQRQTEVTLSAETVVSRAVAVERQQNSQRSGPLWIQHSRPDRRDRQDTAALSTANAQADDAASEPLVPTSDGARELARRLAGYGYDPATPLSARHFETWRRSTSIRAEHLQTVHGADGALLKVATSASAGDVREAELIVRDGTYEAVSQQWHFADGLRVAVTSLAPTMPSRERRAEAAVPAAPAAPTRPPIDLESTELAIRSDLHNAGVAVGLQIRVARADRHVLVQGDVPGPAMLAKVGSITRTSEGARTSVRIAVPTPMLNSIPDTAGLHLWLQQTLPDGATRERFLTQTYELRERLRTAATVLADLARRYPPDVAGALTADQQRTLTALAGRQLADLTAAYVALEQHLAALAGTVSRPTLPDVLPHDWQVRALAAHEAATGLTEALAAILTDPVAQADDVVPSARRALRPTLTTLAAAIAGQSDAP